MSNGGMMDCPRCDATGWADMGEFDGKPFRMTCPVCEGAGEIVSPRILHWRAMEYMDALIEQPNADTDLKIGWCEQAIICENLAIEMVHHEPARTILTDSAKAIEKTIQGLRQKAQVSQSEVLIRNKALMLRSK